MRLPLGLVSVGGHSMAPTLHEGDVLVHAALPAREGDLVVAQDPRADRLIVKRVLAAGGDELLLGSDARGHECLFVGRGDVLGRVLFRYHRLS